MVTRLLSVLALLTLCACTSAETTRDEQRPGESFAASTMRAGGVPYGRDAPSIEAAWSPSFTRGWLGGNELLTISRLATGDFIGGAISSTNTDPSDGDGQIRLMAFMPSSLAPGANAAQDGMSTILLDASEAALTSLEGKPPIRIDRRVSFTRSLFSDERVDLLYGEWHIKECGVLERGYCWLRIVTGSWNTPKKVQAPSFRPPGMVWQFSKQNGSFGWAPVAASPGVDRALVDEFSLYRDISQRLPDWAYLYLPPRRIGYRDPDGSLKLFPVPVVLNQGRAHFFVRGAGIEEGRKILGWDAAARRPNYAEGEASLAEVMP